MKYLKATPHKARLTTLYVINLYLFRHLAQKFFAIRQYACKISIQSDEKSNCVSAAQSLCGVALKIKYITAVSVISIGGIKTDLQSFMLSLYHTFFSIATYLLRIRWKKRRKFFVYYTFSTIIAVLVISN